MKRLMIVSGLLLGVFYINNIVTSQDLEIGKPEESKKRGPYLEINISGEKITVQGKQVNNEQLVKIINEWANKDKDAGRISNSWVLIQADSSTKFKEISKIMEFCGRAGIWKLEYASGEEKISVPLPKDTGMMLVTEPNQPPSTKASELVKKLREKADATLKMPELKEMEHVKAEIQEIAKTLKDLQEILTRQEESDHWNPLRIKVRLGNIMTGQEMKEQVTKVLFLRQGPDLASETLDVDHLTKILIQEQQSNPAIVVIIDAEGDVPYTDILKIMRACTNANISNIEFAAH